MRVRTSTLAGLPVFRFSLLSGHYGWDSGLLLLLCGLAIMTEQQ